MRRAIRRFSALVVATMCATAPATLLACPICFQFDPSPTTNGVVAAVAVLMGVTVSVLVAVGVFVRRFAINDAELHRSTAPELHRS